MFFKRRKRQVESFEKSPLGIMVRGILQNLEDRREDALGHLTADMYEYDMKDIVRLDVVSGTLYLKHKNGRTVIKISNLVTEEGGVRLLYDLYESIRKDKNTYCSSNNRKLLRKVIKYLLRVLNEVKM
jgi:hypothetical protein